MKSFKKNLVIAFQSALYVDGLKGNKLIVITAAGVFVGNPAFEGNSMTSFVEDFAEDYRKKNSIPADQPLDDNDGCLILTDATLIAGGTRNIIPMVTIFFDQIIGVSWGDIE